MIAQWTVTLFLAACVSCAAQQEVSSPTGNIQSVPAGESRTFKPDDEMGMAYHQTNRSIEAAERFIREYPNERDFCAGALLNIADLQARVDKRKAIESYQKAVDTYGCEIVPCKNFTCTVADWALLRIARLERNTGNREKALKIFGKLMNSPEFNTRTSSRIEYLATKQSHLQVTAEVSVKGKGPFSSGSRIPVVVKLRNPSEEVVTLKCYVEMGHREHKSSRGITPREDVEETTLQPGEARDVPMEFTEMDTKRIEPGIYDLKASLTGIPYDTTSVAVKIGK